VTSGAIRTVLGDRHEIRDGVVYAHEHLILDSPLIEDRFPHIHLYDVDAAVAEVSCCAEAGAVLMLDAMPISAGRDILRLAEIASRTRVDVVASTGLHHDRYYGPRHWTNRVGCDALAELFIADLTDGVDEFDYTGPIVRRTMHRAGVVKVATSGPTPDVRDRRNLEAAAIASRATGAPVLTHCEGGSGAIAQVEILASHGVPSGNVIVSHVDKAGDLPALHDIAATGAVLELDQSLRHANEGTASFTIRAIVSLIEAGFERQIVVGTDGARRSLWSSLGGEPGLAWLATALPRLLTEMGLDAVHRALILHENAVAALRWRDVG
jgi:phosphotriesterase-related protein